MFLQRACAYGALRRASARAPRLLRETAAARPLQHLPLGVVWQMNDNTKQGLWGAALAVALGAASVAASCDSKEWPVFSSTDVAQHKSADAGIWVSYEGGVYDITEFVESHPGGRDKIMMAAGGRVDPFWALYSQHKTKDVKKVLAGLRIGTLDAKSARDAQAALDANDPYANEPRPRHPALKVAQEKPFNAETAVALIPDHYITPNELWYCRHHHPVPDIDASSFRFELCVDHGSSPTRLSVGMAELKEWYPSHTATVTTQCGGNRRSELNDVAKTQGLSWGVGTISTATWRGVYVRDILASVGVTDVQSAIDAGIRHIQFIGDDAPYDASVPVEIALDPRRPVMLAFEMNGEPVPREHGGPLRAVVPGVLGARSVKWVTRVVASSEPARSSWQRGFPYKGMSPNLRDFKGVDPDTLPTVYEMPVQSAIVSHSAGATVDAGATTEVSGYAWSGGGRNIARVDVSADGGKTWTTAQLGQGSEQEFGQAWAWTFWSADLDVPADDSAELVCKAIDVSMNSQPDSPKGIWNLRGILNNSWHRVPVQVAQDDE